MKTYIAGAVTDVENYKELFDEAARELIEKGLDPVLPIDLPHQHDKRWTSYMRECLTLLLDCDAIYMLKNYRDSKGAKVEYDLAKVLGLKIIMQ